uniref:Uncharacterized protein n=1 Tax=Pseudictyota dubia TaxID=2749911 RepID=A0A7R9ZF84_9STRA|mmetsp:Transcript_47027/g.87355  ORF Transcript_47027/g.87355 Transcript_47027/m.87355 type:complete len:260 (+) Transcript_47027:129-908(+)
MTDSGADCSLDTINLAPNGGLYRTHIESINEYNENRKIIHPTMSDILRRRSALISSAVCRSMGNSSQCSRVRRILRKSSVCTDVGVEQDILKEFRMIEQDGGGCGGYENWCFDIKFRDNSLPPHQRSMKKSSTVDYLHPRKNSIPGLVMSLWTERGETAMASRATMLVPNGPSRSRHERFSDAFGREDALQISGGLPREKSESFTSQQRPFAFPFGTKEAKKQHFKLPVQRTSVSLYEMLEMASNTSDVEMKEIGRRAA